MPLIAERVRELLHYDPETGIFTWIKQKTPSVPVGRIAGCLRDDGRVVIGIDGGSYFAHRLAWLYVYGEWPSLEIDHVNGKPGDNRFSNIRVVTHFVNMQNLHGPMSHNKTSTLLGVSFNKKRNRWVAQIRANGKSYFIGRFRTVDEAQAAYLNAKATIHPLATYGRD